MNFSPEDLAKEREADIGPIREYSAEERAEIYARQAKERKERKEAERLATENETTAPLCLSAVDPIDSECQLNITNTSVPISQEKKLPKVKKAKKPLPERVDFIPMYKHYINNLQYSLSEVIFLSEIDCLMQRKKKPCHVSAQHLASAARITVETAYNILSKLETSGVIIDLGYSEGRRTKDRIVAPKYSRFPTISNQILKARGKEPAPF